MRIGFNSPQDVFALFIRRKWWVIAPFLALSSAAAVLIFFLPSTYVSETLILVRPRDVPRDLVRDLIASSAEERLRAIEQQILSRTNLVQIMREFGDRLPELQPLNIDDQVEKLRKQIKISFSLGRAGNGGEQPLTYFRISYQNQNPELAQKIASKLTALFIEQDNKTRETQVFGTTDFFSAELDKVSRDLKQSDDELRVVKGRRLFELPERSDANLRTLDRLGDGKRANTEALDRYATLRLNLETQLAQTPRMVPKSTQSLSSTVRSPEAERRRKAQADLEEYRRAQTEYDELTSRYTENHPDVQKALARLERLKQRLPPELQIGDDLEDGTDAAKNETMEPNPVYEKLLAQLQEVNTETRYREREKTFIDSEIVKYSARVENTPQAEQEISDVARVNGDFKKQHDDLKNKLTESRLAESLESKQKGAQFVVVDPANYPIVPDKPDKKKIMLAGAFISLLISIGLAATVDVTRQKAWTQSQVEAFWGAPVLIEVPEIVTDADLIAARKMKLVYAATSVAGVAVYGVCLYVMYLKHSFILHQLDPVIQSLIYK